MIKEKNSTFFNVTLAIISALILSVFFISVYETFTSPGDSKSSLFKNPEIIAVIIGLIVSILFVERWKSLESRVQKLSEGPVETLSNIQAFAKQEMEQRFKDVESKAQALRANVSNLVEKHPWLEVISEREIIVETDSCRGILRTCYSLLKDEKFLHLFEYLEYCCRKGTSLDKRKEKTPLRGTADDFFEIATFCEIWLGDYYLSSQFLKRYLEQYPDSAYILLPEYIRKLLRIGDLGAVKENAKFLRKKVYGENIYSQIRLFLRLDNPVSERFKWLSANVLLLSDSTLSNPRRLEKYINEIKQNKFSKLYVIQQNLFDVELMVQVGEFKKAIEKIAELKEDDLSILNLGELGYLYSKMGNYDEATKIRELILNQNETNFGDNSYKKKNGRNPKDKDYNNNHLDNKYSNEKIKNIEYEIDTEIKKEVKNIEIKKENIEQNIKHDKKKSPEKGKEIN